MSEEDIWVGAVRPAIKANATTIPYLKHPIISHLLEIMYGNKVL
jgi:hypothetical protein